ncbi:hypothetical protein QLX67_12650 [Balneolaceae bacterium ANBcel3]|nr:hypothetical protein [Balneolaceae bacterium ANBcel3]
MANRNIDITESLDHLNEWVRRSINEFNSDGYLDKIGEVYNYRIAQPERIKEELRRAIKIAHNNRNDVELIRLLSQLDKFPYDEPFWYLIKNATKFSNTNPSQIRRICETLYNMTDEEVIIRVESQPKLNQQTGPMFNNWLRAKFEVKNLNEFKASSVGFIILGESEEVGRKFLTEDLNQNVSKRPDLIAKVNDRYIIGEAKWIGQSGGNQYKSVAEVIKFCEYQRGNVLRIGIIDGYPWLTHNTNGNLIKDRICIEVQESTYNLMSSLLLVDYMESIQALNPSL